MTREEIKARYDALKEPEYLTGYWGGMNGWYDRLYPFEEFMKRGQEVADAMRGGTDNREAFPDLWDLLFDAFP